MSQTPEMKVKALKAELNQLLELKKRRTEEHRAAIEAVIAARRTCFRLRAEGKPTAKAVDELDRLTEVANNKRAVLDDLDAEIGVLVSRLNKARQEAWLNSL